MKKVLKIIGKVAIVLLLFVTLLTVFIAVSGKINKSKTDKIISAYNSHPKKYDMLELSPENIGVSRKSVNKDYIVGTHYVPNKIRHKGVVVTFGGSEGSKNEYMANYLSSDGYEVVAVYYFGKSGQPENIDRVPLELYEEIYSYIEANCENSDTITIVGISSGSELALLLSTYYDTINNVVLFDPGSYVVGATYLNEGSRWTYDGKDVDFLNGKPGAISKVHVLIDDLLNKPYAPVILMNAMTKGSSNLENARIKTENSNAKVLIFYGGEDNIWDSKSAAKIIKEHVKNEIIIHGYENAGHGFYGPRITKLLGHERETNFGGTVDANIEADLDSKRILLETLELWHK